MNCEMRDGLSPDFRFAFACFQFVGDFKACSHASVVILETGPKLFSQRHCCQFMGLIYRFINWIKAHDT